MPSLLKVTIFGASGYVGAELTALLCRHPQVGTITYVSRSLAGQPVATHMPALRGCVNSTFQAPSEEVFAESDVAFFATPHGVAMNSANALLMQNTVVIDLSPDFRLKDIAIFEKWYGQHTSPELLPQAVYGLTESARPALKNANLIACPGCFATAIELALIPLVAAGSVNDHIIVDAKSGVSGAGKRTDRTDLLFAEQTENFKAYAVEGHRHQPEIEQAVRQFAGHMPPMAFVPHLLPTARGLYVSAYVPLSADAFSLLQTHWADELFIDVLDDGLPEISHVTRTNRVQLAARPLPGGITLVIAALDNLLKGAAGQAVQNMNVRFGLPEDMGLSGARTV
ncbi:N-acetyl-gamma-glutamyl-phosphate reductase [Candidatus Persebacteraceae bacterium Df01]|uniref:N-acetyl-gamma-glutamyl-phosphate reductase n=1 Tax=Candidatus Doriopsillibacter californiensis TaxID=2970740 RepID=A0ABT7QL87_9GAMM|nr:N-acetyl-gamma-glutamyl-phosphate reductase [Candidatus Persebacteraceae bacterium Df01]